MDESGSLIAIWGIGIVLLGLIMAMAVMMWRKRPRDPGTLQRRDMKTREMYKRNVEDG